VERFLFKWRFARARSAQFWRNEPEPGAARIDASNARHFVGVAQRRRGPPLFLWDGWCP
jgi:hypothetical protein